MIEFSIVVPIYNSEKYLKDCIDSVVNQTYKNWELVLVNDGSTDSSMSICEKYRYDNRIKIIEKKNEGVSKARNIGIKESNGKRIIFLDSDDRLEIDTLEKLIHHIANYDYDIIEWALKTDEGDKYPLCESVLDAKQNDLNELKDLKYRAFSGYSLKGEKDYASHFIVTKAIKKELILKNEIYFMESLKYHEDTLFCINIMNVATSILSINEYFYTRTIHNNSASSSYYSEISKNNEIFLNCLSDIIKLYDDQSYKVAFIKFQFSTFFQCMKLDIMNEKAMYSKKEKKNKIKVLLKNKAFIPSYKIIFYNIAFKYKMLYLVFKLKQPFLINLIYNTMKG